ncbi:ATP-binding protein [Sphingomonas sp. BK069]|uniref:PAS domain-containing sensor histidine kinase n=1 Tax=Sphingomonas sp. BK069 TaxID=2586979 RepID=UPI001614D92B|nr:ATP-binding protein [Sphingomonas sp. BK069]MBB3348314.1 PAS domain S-box-containing protein [Sphingomonas sp. BK069]
MQRVSAQMLDLSSESMISTGADGEVTSWNLASKTLYGWQPHEAIGRSLADLLGRYPPAAIRAVQATGLWEGRVDRRRRDGTACTVRLRVARAAGTPAYELMEVSSLLEVEHPAEKALAASRHRYRNLFGAVAASFWELDFADVGRMIQALARSGIRDIPEHLRADPDIARAMMRATRIVDTNDRSVEMFGPATKRELLATPLDYYWPEESTRDFAESVISAITNKPRHVAETRMRALDGRIFDALFTVSFLPGAIGGGTLLVGFTDISDRVQAARQLGDLSARRQMLLDVPTIALSELTAPEVAESFRRLRSEGVTDIGRYVDTHPEYVDFVIASLRLATVNDAAVRLFGASSAQELIGRSMTGIIPPGCEVLRRSVEGSFVREPVFQSEMRMLRLDGHPVDTLFCRVSNPDPSSSEVLVAQIDITDQVRARSEVDRMRQQLAHESRISLLGQLTASIVHEVSQPVTAIANHAAAAERLAMRPAPSLERLAGVVSMIGQHAVRVGEIIHRLRAVAANRQVALVRLSLEEVAAEARVLLRQELDERGIRLVTGRDGVLPLVMGDRIQLQQVLANLMLNAIQALDEVPRAARRIDLQLRSDARAVEVAIVDSGPGLSPEFLAAPFQTFRTSKPDGLGMGLTICRSIAEAHGGSVSVKNREDGRGAVSSLLLPAAD